MGYCGRCGRWGNRQRDCYARAHNTEVGDAWDEDSQYNNSYAQYDAWDEEPPWRTESWSAPTDNEQDEESPPESSAPTRVGGVRRTAKARAGKETGCRIFSVKSDPMKVKLHVTDVAQPIVAVDSVNEGGGDVNFPSAQSGRRPVITKWTKNGIQRLGPRRSSGPFSCQPWWLRRSTA